MLPEEETFEQANCDKRILDRLKVLEKANAELANDPDNQGKQDYAVITALTLHAMCSSVETKRILNPDEIHYATAELNKSAALISQNPPMHQVIVKCLESISITPTLTL